MIFGPTEIDTQVTDSGCGIERIQFYIDGELRHTSYDDTLEWWWNKRTIGVHTIEIVAQDILGHTSSIQLNVWVFNL